MGGKSKGRIKETKEATILLQQKKSRENLQYLELEENDDISLSSNRMTAAVLSSSSSSQHSTGIVVSCPPAIIFTEAIKDSPEFRGSLAQHILYFNRLESRLKEMLKHIMGMIEFSKQYVETFYKLTVSVNQLCDESFSGNALAQSTFGSLSDAYAHTVSLSKAYHEQSNLLVYNKLTAFIKNELAKVHDAREHFETMSASMDDALLKNAVVSKARPGDAIEGRNTLTSVGACFAHATLDYVAQINITHARKDHVVLDALWSIVAETSSYFSRGHAVFDEWTASDNGAVADSIAALAVKSRLTERKMQDIHSLVPKDMFQHPSGMPPDPHVMMEGYLFKRSSNAFKTWNRRWFQIKDNKLLYSHRSAEVEQPTVMEENLMLCLVRPAPSSVDRVACFELVTPTRSHLLQADSESLCNAWMRALQRTILALHEYDGAPKASSSSTSKSDSKHSQIGGETYGNPAEGGTNFEQIRRVPGNDRCADCGAKSEQPKWVSINLGVVLCIECSGVHRSLGVQISKVRSLTMDSIDTELRDVLLSLGNTHVNDIYLHYLPEKDIIPPQAVESSSRQVREAWIKAKYVDRIFAIAPIERTRCTAYQRKEHLSRHPRRLSIGGVTRSSSFGEDLERDAVSPELLSPSPTDLSKRLSSCGSETNLAASQVEMTNGVESPDWPSIEEAARTGNVLSLLKAVATKADINTIYKGTTALHIATQNGQTAAVEFLLLNGAKINVVDDRMNTPLHLAALEGNTLQVCQLLKRGADKNLKNIEGVTPLDVAVEGKHADIVTLFRVHTMRDEFNEEFNNPMDDTVDSVISDITRRAATAAKSSSG